MSLPLAAHLPQAEQREHRGEELSSDQSNLPVEEPAHGLDTCDSIEKLDSPPSADESETPARETEPSTQDANDATNTSGVVKNKPHSVFNHKEKRLIILCAGICSFFSPVSGSIYLPALDAIAGDLHVSYNLITLSVTTYMIMQGLAPAFIGGFSDEAGRRPSYVICFVVYIAANIGLGVQNSYPALMVLRCIQSAGSSATVALANAVVADMVTSQERGIYVSYMSIAPQAGPSLGPVIGGLLAKYLGWHSIFWFLLIVAGVVFMPFLFFFPETCRTVVDDGSVPPPKWNRCYTNNSLERRLINAGWAISYEKRNILAKERNLRFPNPLRTVRIIFMKESGFALWYIAIVCCGLYATTILIPNQFGSVYNFNELQISLCYLPLGVGSMLAAVVRGRIIDSRYRHYAKKLGMSLESNRNVDLSNFPIERARLEVALPTLALGSLCIIGFGWMIEYKVNLAGPLIFLFVIGFCVSASMNTVAVLLIDVFPGRAGTATAANNMCRCWLGAAATSGVSPMIGKVGIGWTTTFFGGLAIVFSPILWYIMINGPTWRRTTQENKDREQAERAGRAYVRDEEGNA